jgi:hypothetical protein
MNIEIIAIIVLALLVIGLVYVVHTLHKRVDLLLRGKDAKNLEDSIHAILDELERVHQKLKVHDGTLSEYNNRITDAVKSVPTLRFNPFSDSGGNQSFASAFITEKGDGVVISSLYSREKTSVFAKPIKGFDTDYELTAEEQEVLKQAREA